MVLEIRKIEFGSNEYQAEVNLRDLILRKPLGLKFTDEQLKAEHSDIHIGAFYRQNIVGCLILTPQGTQTIKMRQVAVDESMQGKGIGKELVKYAESFARASGFSEMVLNARTTVVPFYENLGYEALDGEFVEVSIPHRKMKKKI